MENKKVYTDFIHTILFIFIFIIIILCIGYKFINYTPKNKIILIDNSIRKYKKLDTNSLNEFNDNQPDDKSINLKVLSNFLTHAESKYLIRVANNRFSRSKIIDDRTKNNKASHVRTSQSAFFKKSEYKLLKNIELRAAKLLKVKYVQLEPLQIVKYQPGEKYGNHYDWFKNPNRTRDSKGQRLKTMFVYLNEGYEGGSTSFPKINFTYFGKTGDALMWDKIKNGKPDYNTLHSGDEIEAGTKYGMNIWIRER